MDKFRSSDIETDVFNLIPSQFPTVSVYADIAEPESFNAIYNLEGLTNPRLIAEKRFTHGNAQGSENQLQNWNLAPLTYPNPTGTTYFEPIQSSVELYASRELALTIAIGKREAFLRDAAMPPMNVDVRMFKRRLGGCFAEVDSPAKISQSIRWQIGREIADNDNYQGVRFNNALLDGHSVFGIIDGKTLGKAEQTDHYSLLWDGKKVAKIGHYRLHETFETVGQVINAESRPGFYRRSG